MKYIKQIVFIICSICFINYINQAATTGNEGSQQNPFVTLSSILSQQSLLTSNNIVSSSVHITLIPIKNVQDKYESIKQTSYNDTLEHLLSLKMIFSFIPSTLKRHIKSSFKVQNVDDKNEYNYINEINDSDSPLSASNDVTQGKTKGESMIHLSVPTKSRPHLSRNDTKCNNAVMRKVIIQNIHSNPATAKRLTQLAVRDKFSGFIDAICSTQPFSYVINSDLYCEVQKFNVTCLVFRQAVQ